MFFLLYCIFDVIQPDRDVFVACKMLTKVPTKNSVIGAVPFVKVIRSLHSRL